MQVRVLGPVQACRADQVWSPGGPKERKLLAVLAVRLGEAVSIDAIADALWDGQAPRSAVKSVQLYVTRLRAALDPARTGEAVIRTVARGYRLEIDRADLDAHAFADLIRQAREALERGEPIQAATLVDEAFGLWRGTPYTEFADSDFFNTEVRRLTETRLSGLDVRLAAALAQGRQADVVIEAEALCAEYPLREGFWIHLITALYRCGRQADALAAFRRIRTTLADEIGADPSAELRTLEQRILRQDPSLEVPDQSGSGPEPLPPELDPAGRPFIGRSDELAWLRQRWSETVAADSIRLLAVTGPPGSGRTRLLAEFAAELHADGVTVHYGELGAGLAVLDEPAGELVAQLQDAGPGPMLCVALCDPDQAIPGAEMRRLAPLSRSEVARIVENIAGTVAADLVEEVAMAAGSWPGPVQRLTTELVRERSAQRVTAAAEQAEPASRTLTAARDEVAAAVRELTRIQAWHGRGASEAGAVACPYKGLAAYEEADAPLFHGREDLVASLCARLVDTSFVAVVGPSGAGKSSLVRAGLLPALANGVLPLLAEAPQWILMPGAPLPELDGPAILVVDQFEEIFTAPVDDAERERYLDELTALTQRRGVRVVVCLRGDFVGACVVHFRLAQLVGDGTVLVGPMRREEIRRAIELPARQVGLYVEPALLDALVSDVEGQPGALPLMSTALVEVWQRRSGSTLTAAAYHQSGGVSGAVARVGESAYAGLDGQTRGAARRMLLRLAESDENGGVVRRRVPRAELGEDPATARALGLFIARRLLTASERGVEVTHESVLTYWPRLSGWLADDEQGRALRRHLGPAALDWNGADRPETELYRGARLASALDWADERRADLTEVEREFLEASRDFADRELQEEIARAGRLLRGRRRLRTALASALALLLVAVATTVVAIDRYRAADQASRESLAHRLGALALVTVDLDRSLLLAVQAVRIHDDAETRGALVAALGRRPQAQHQVRGQADKGVIGDITVTGDGSTLVAVGGAGKMFTWDARTVAGPPQSDVIAEGGNNAAVLAAADGRSVFTFAFLGPKNKMVTQWDAVERRTLATYPMPEDAIGSGQRMALAAGNQTLAVPMDEPSLLLYDLGTKAPPRRVELQETPGDIWPAGPYLVTAANHGERAYFVDPRTARVVQTLRLPFAGRVTASPNGRELLVVSEDRKTLISADDGRVIREFTGATRSAAVAAFSADGTLVAVGGKDRRIGVWDVADGELRDVLDGHSAPIQSLFFRADGRVLYSSSSDDNSVIAWDVSGADSFPRKPSREPVLEASKSATQALGTFSPPLVAWSADRRHVYINNVDGNRAARIDVQTGRQDGVVKPFPIGQADAGHLADLDRNDIFLTTLDGELARRDLSSAAITRRTQGVAYPLIREGVAISADGSTVATPIRNDKRPESGAAVEIYDPQTLQLRRSLPTEFASYSVWLNRDGSLLVNSFADPKQNFIEVLDTRTGLRRWKADVHHPFWINAVVWTADGKTVIAASHRGDVVALDVSTGTMLDHYEQQVTVKPTSITVSANGEFLAYSGTDAQVHLLSVAGLREIALLPMPGAPEWTNVSFDPDGDWLSAVDDRGNLARWEINPRTWMNRACSIAGRDFYQAEWDKYLPGNAFERTCTNGLLA